MPYTEDTLVQQTTAEHLKQESRQAISHLSDCIFPLL